MSGISGLKVRALRRPSLLTTDAVLADWQEERPPAPAYIRILYLGKVLQDNDTLSSACLLPTLVVGHSSLLSVIPPRRWLPPCCCSAGPQPPCLLLPSIAVAHYPLSPMSLDLSSPLILTELKIPIHTLTADVPPPQPTIVHLSVRACAPSGDEQDPKKKRKGDSDDEDSSRGCCASCIIC